MAPNRTVAPSDSVMVAWIAEFIARHHRAPRVREFAAGVGLRSASSGHRHLAHLRERGLVAWEDGMVGTLRVLDPPSP